MPEAFRYCQSLWKIKIQGTVLFIMYRFESAQGAGNRSNIMWNIRNRDLATAGRATPGQGDMALQL